MSAYRDALRQAMRKLSGFNEALFLGQSLAFGGTAMAGTFDLVQRGKVLEVPVFENTQLGMAIGYALVGGLPICCYPRIDFLLEATSQLVNHLDKFPAMGLMPKVIVRTAIGDTNPLDPGPQHHGDYAAGFAAMLDRVVVFAPKTPEEVEIAYDSALKNIQSSVIVERLDLY